MNSFAPLVTGLVFLVLHASAACAQERSDTAHSFNCSRGPFRLRLPESYPAVRTIGQLRNEEVVGVESWGKFKSEDRVLTFDGLRLDLITFTDDKSRYLISSARVTSPAWTLAGGFRVGGSADAAAARLGVKKTSNVIAVNGDTDSLEILVANGAIKQITYRCYTG